ncbi:MAG: hypothetical protein HY286_05545 [Planctomycetes bacterium]|nr:hypothetical protein [Planctomycetota bacterium]
MQIRIIITAVLAIALLVTGGIFLASNASAGAGQAPPPIPAPRIDHVAVARIPERTIGGRAAGFEVIITGSGYYGTAFGPFVNFNKAEAVAVVIDSESRITAFAAPEFKGNVEVEVKNPDGQTARASVAFP